jgi:GntR family transcriptional regulator
MAKAQSVERHGTVPAYIQVASALRRRIETGDWAPGAKISTLEELEEEFRLARVTVRQAVGLLEKEGLVTRRQGRGTFVNEDINDKRWLQLETTWDYLIKPIRENVPKFIKVSNPPAAPRLLEGEGELAPDYAFLRSVQLKDGEPYAVVNVHLAQRVFDPRKDAYLKHTALSVLATQEGANIKRAHETLMIGTADLETAELLGIPLSAPTAECRIVVIDQDDVAIYVADLTYRSDRIKLYVNLLDRGTTAPKAAPRRIR